MISFKSNIVNDSEKIYKKNYHNDKKDISKSY